MIRVVAEEIVGDRTVAWSQGMTEMLRDDVRLYLERYPDLLPETCSYLIVAWHFGPGMGSEVFCVDAVRDEPGSWVLRVRERWYDIGRDDRELLYVTEMLIRSWMRDGTLAEDPDTPGSVVLTMPDGTTLRDEDADKFTAAAAEVVVALRAKYGGDFPPVRFT
jgi:hypothetical protein